MEHLSEISIHQKYISIFASGLSILDLDPFDFIDIKNHSFMISTNYPLSLIDPSIRSHIHIWGDPKPTRFINANPDLLSGCEYLAAREQAFDGLKNTSAHKSCNYIFNNRKDKLLGNCTVMWVLDLLKKKYPDKIFLLFGVDGYVPETSELRDGILCTKWYDYYTTHDMTSKNGSGKLTTRSNDLALDHINQFNDFFEKVHKNKEKQYPDNYYYNVFNCSEKTRVRYIPRRNYKDIFYETDKNKNR